MCRFQFLQHGVLKCLSTRQLKLMQAENFKTDHLKFPIDIVY